MRIVDFDEFLNLPVGTVYMKYEPCVFGDLRVKDRSLSRDFYYTNITYELDCIGSDGFANKLFEAQENKTSIKTDFDTVGRDGYFEDSQLFAVYEKEDVDRLITKLNESLKNAYI